MVKTTKVVECDVCGRIDIMKLTYVGRNEDDYQLPMEWKHFKNADLCPHCRASIEQNARTDK